MIDFSGESLPSLGEIVLDSAPTKNCVIIKGIYFLIRDKSVVYVGSSVNTIARIGTHITDRQKDFNAYSILHCPNLADKDLTAIEAYYVLRLQPEYNCGVPGNSDFISYKQIKTKYGIQLHDAKKLLRQHKVKPFGEFQGYQYYLRSDLDKLFGIAA